MLARTLAEGEDVSGPGRGSQDVECHGYAAFLVAEVGFEDRREPVEFSHERARAGRGLARGQQFANPPEDSRDQGVIFDEVVDHRGELGCGGAQCGPELVVLTAVMCVDRGAKAEAVAEQTLREGSVRGNRAAVAGGLLAQRGEPLPQRPVDVNQLFAERGHAIRCSQRG